MSTVQQAADSEDKVSKVDNVGQLVLTRDVHAVLLSALSQYLAYLY